MRPALDELAESMRRAQEGDREAYEAVLTHCRDVFDRLARERCARGAPEEVVRRCLLTLHRVRHTFDPGRSFSAWVEAIARHHGIAPACGRHPRRVWRAWIDGLLGIMLRGTRDAGTSPACLAHPEGAAET